MSQLHSARPGVYVIGKITANTKKVSIVGSLKVMFDNSTYANMTKGLWQIALKYYSLRQMKRCIIKVRIFQQVMIEKYY